MNTPKADDSHRSSVSLNAMVNSFHRELLVIADWWVMHSLDETHGGFFGEIDASARPSPQANKGVVLNSRLLWFFSEVARATGEARYQSVATRAYDYLQSHFFDPTHGGYVWEVDCRGQVVRDRKQIYAQAFCIYGLVAYYRMSHMPIALDQAVDLFRILQSRCVDAAMGGYIEAFSVDWHEIEDHRLSEVDRNFPKTMNTHLHVLEALTSLHGVVGSDETCAALARCIEWFDVYILDHHDLRLRTFLDSGWNDHSQERSYGHEIEFSWLICEACHALGDVGRTLQFEAAAVQIVDRILNSATGEDGQVLEHQLFGQPVHPESAWWVQAESLVGFLNAFQISGEPRFAKALRDTWEFIHRYHKSSVSSEWSWLPTNRSRPLPPKYLGGFWKAPYHNGRAMLEVLRRLSHPGPVRKPRAFLRHRPSS